MAGRKVEGVGRYEGWTLEKYAWKGPRVKSPLTNQELRGVVGVDEEGRFRGGYRIGALRNGSPTAQTQVMFDVRSSSSKDEAIYTAHEMVRAKVIDGARWVAEAAQQKGEIVDVRVESRTWDTVNAHRNCPAEKYGAPLLEHSQEIKEPTLKR